MKAPINQSVQWKKREPRTLRLHQAFEKVCDKHAWIRSHFYDSFVHVRPWAETTDGKRVIESVKSIKSVVDHDTDRWIFIWICPPRSRQRLEWGFFSDASCWLHASVWSVRPFTPKSNVGAALSLHRQSLPWFVPMYDSYRMWKAQLGLVKIKNHV